MTSTPVLKFAPFSSSADTAFWHSLSNRKLTDYRLSKEAQPIFASFATGHRPDMPARAAVSAESFERDPAAARVGQVYLMRGDLFNTNTLDEFKKADIAAMTQTCAGEIARAITSGDVLSDNSQLHRFVLLTFSDLKKYKFYYWFAFPALVPTDTPLTQLALQPIADSLTEEQMSAIAAGVTALCASTPTLSAFIVDMRGSDEDDGPAAAVLPLTDMAPEMFDDERVLFAVMDASGVAAHTSKHVKGVEKDSKGRLVPRVCDLAGTMDPTRLATTAVDLNLKLMRWRLMPSVDLERIAATKCLLLGAGTLGCNVARALLGWGVRHITFVDNGRVSFSNPVRQSLFQFEDCLDGGKPKAETAALRLRQIFPGVTTRGIVMSIPMAGHPVSPAAFPQTMANTRKLQSLISEHDVVFLLTDTREARWLPTVIAAAENKVCMTAALGFDTYVAMRHGHPSGPSGNMTTGCYFCNDGTAPQNSTRDRTLDQQCTVSRPGVSMIAAATVVELLISLMHHPQGVTVGLTDPSDDDASPMGAVPQQIRGSVSGFSSMLFAGHPFSHCIACSRKVVDLWQSDPERLLRDAVNDPKLLEDLTGITEMKALVDNLADIDIDIDISDDEAEAN
ncbi:hypothetical protein PTSG_03857 [Salpingoeca rosetta]|uniref:Ubiquitin-like modifier-activating enzyme ATG7 n=1 Tax=Salpingoeca rosetta (strain ATCC 50818 / BSB-021) TaxID=946362 RepID=F2U5K9_SALR5|nr:uncharacterized protein PTSG_03857 [Salpingoeca rosetta]EGD83225.1 hypothetical protein PTSG_03857 [Salpingoeca rosetta]|eukprot:XP_004995589.1 hypothetical protein PTSG_03857 [Salpingoeca rosetta]